jgi:acyl carrier protein
LPNPHRARPLSTPPATAKNEIEIALVAIWKDILRLDEIGVDDSFLELGGDSLQLMRMFNRTRDVFGHDVSIAEFFAAPTVSGLAKIFEQLDKAAPGSSE